MSDNNNNIDEISLKDLAISIFSSIVNIIKKYKIVLLFLCVFGIMISIYIDYKSQKAEIELPKPLKYLKLPKNSINEVPEDMIRLYKISPDKKDINKNQTEILIKTEGPSRQIDFRYIYLITIRPDLSISYNYFQDFYNFLRRDLLSQYLFRRFKITSLNLYSPEITGLARDYTTKDFPVNSLNIKITTTNLIDENGKKRFINYILSYIFSDRINILFTTLQRPLMISNDSIILTQDYEQSQIRSEILLFLIQLKERIQAIFDLRNDNLGENYRLIYDYLNSINTENKFEYFKMTKDMLLEFVHREFLNVGSLNIGFYFQDIYKYESFKYSINLKKLILSLLITFITSIIILNVFEFFKKNWKDIAK